MMLNLVNMGPASAGADLTMLQKMGPASKIHDSRGVAIQILDFDGYTEKKEIAEFSLPGCKIQGSRLLSISTAFSEACL